MNTRQCIVCKKHKPIGEFSFRRKLTDERHTHCRACQQVYKRNFYLRNRQTYIQKSAREKEQGVRPHGLTHPNTCAF